MFGSVLRDDFGPDSDVDVVAEFQPGHGPGLDFIRIEREFSRLLDGRRVDMVTPKSLYIRIRDRVLASAEPCMSAPDHRDAERDIIIRCRKSAASLGS